MAADQPAETPALPQIVRDEGPASSGGASNTQKVIVASDGKEWPSHAKFAKDQNGAVVAENGERGLASELLASKCADLIKAPVPTVDVVELDSGMDVVLRGGRHAAPGVAIASRTIDPYTDVNGGDSLADAPAADIAGMAVLHAWIEASDRGHNMIRSAQRAFSIDHATAFGSAWAGTEPQGIFAPDSLLQPEISKHPGEMHEAADRLAKVSDAQIDAVVAAIPAEFVVPPEVRERLKAMLKKSRDLVSEALKKAYPEKKGASN